MNRRIIMAAATAFALAGLAIGITSASAETSPVFNTKCESVTTGPVGTNLNGLWTNVDTRTAGHVEYVSHAVHVWTDDATSQAKVSEGTPVALPLRMAGQIDLAWAGTTPPPGVNLRVNFDGTLIGTLVYESVYGQDLWLTNGAPAALKSSAPSHTGGNGSDNHGTINQWLSVYPDAQIVRIAYSLGSGVKGDGLISSVTVGCTKYGFDFAKATPTPTPTVTVTVPGPVVSVPVPGPTETVSVPGPTVTAAPTPIPTVTVKVPVKTTPVVPPKVTTVVPPKGATQVAVIPTGGIAAGDGSTATH